MRELTVLYDPHCGLCKRAQAWLISKPKYQELVFVPASSDEARSRYPRLDHALTLTDLTVISDQGAVYSGSKAWLMCLWALRDYREWALRLSSPELLPTAKRVISMISQNRYQLEGLGSVMFKRAK
jgi:predicted DCC family thiol-disulfide oxidoreductase YuxK